MIDLFSRPAQALQKQLEAELENANGENEDLPMASPTPPSVAIDGIGATLTPIQPDRQRESFELSCARTEKVS